MDVFTNLVTLVSIYVVLASGLNLLVGHGGRLAFCFAAVWGVCAYVAALTQLGRSSVGYIDSLFWTGTFHPLAALGVTVLAGALCAFVFAKVSLSLRGDAFIVATLACQFAAIGLLQNAGALSRGALGLYSLPRLTVGGGLPSGVVVAITAVTAAIVCVAIAAVIARTPFGLSLRAGRDDERSAAAIGIDVDAHNTLAFVIAGAFAGVAGFLQVSYVSFIDPQMFDLSQSILVLAMLIVGGSGNALGPALGALVMVCTPELLRFFGASGQDVASIRNIVFGTLLILVVTFRPHGIIGNKSWA